MTNKGSFLHDKKHAQDEKLCRAQALYEIRLHGSVKYNPRVFGSFDGHKFPGYWMRY